MRMILTLLYSPVAVVPVATSVSADETEALKAEITKAVEKVQEAGEMKYFHIYIRGPCGKILNANVLLSAKSLYALRTKYQFIPTRH